MGLRQSLDEGAGEIGDEIGAELPSTRAEIRDAIPEDIEDIDAVIDALPLERDR